MSDLSYLFKDEHVDPWEIQIKRAFNAAGLDIPSVFNIDGKIHRFSTNGLKRDDSGWYCLHDNDGIIGGQFGNWRDGTKLTFRQDVGRAYSPQEEMAHRRAREAAAKAAQEAKEENNRIAADTCATIWDRATLATDEHPYLKRKGIKSHDCRVTGDGRLIVPMFGEDGDLVSLQYIDATGGKRYHKGGKTGGAWHLLGEPDGAKAVCVAEGYATAASIHKATGAPVYICFSASNIPPVAVMARAMHPDADLVVCADNDMSGIGRKYADQASAVAKARVVVAPGDEGTDFNDLEALGEDIGQVIFPPVDDWLISADDFSAQPAPIRWLIKGWLQKEAMCMVHGPSGGGKTFAVLDWCLHIAAGFEEWHGQKVKPGPVVYLAGEGHHGLRGRVAAWKQEKQAKKLNMWLSKSGCDLNTPEGYRQAVDAIRATPQPPCLVVVDTLHRFLEGDENSAQDAKTMLDACAGLMREFNCSVLLVHHTGVSDEAKHRARGSSAWKGALENEISVVPGETIQLVQRKMKDADVLEPMDFALNPVVIEGWFDEDDEPVTSCVLELTDAPQPEKKELPHARMQRIFERTWFASGCKRTPEGVPYITREALEELLVQDGKSIAAAKNYCKPGYEGNGISKLIQTDLARCVFDGRKVIGFAVKDEDWIRSLISKS